MLAQSFRCIFLGENPSWLKITKALAQSPFVSLTVQRAYSFDDACHALSTGPGDALALDLHASNFQALDSIQKFRSELPAFPILALFDPSAQDLPDLAAKALRAGASRCLSVHDLTAETMHHAIRSLIPERKTQPPAQKDSDMGLYFRKDSAHPPSRSEVVSHAVNNLLCVINANADVLADHFADSTLAAHSVHEIKKAAKSAADLIRSLK
jgi:DNA-binding NarL/FixJ family response regulator